MGGQGSLMLVESEGWLSGLIQQMSYCSPNAKKCNTCAFRALLAKETPGTSMYYEKKANQQRQCVGQCSIIRNHRTHLKIKQ